jgi:itaconyl-CoA hydratase
MNLPSQFKIISENRYRETSGLYFEDFELGAIFEHRPGRTLSEADNTWFSLLTMNTQPLHIDRQYCAATEWKRPLMNSTFVLAVLTGMSVRTVSQKVVANLGWDRVRCVAPVFEGDTLYAESIVLNKRESAKRPGQGIVTVETRGLNQKGELVMSFERTVLVYKRGHAPEEASGY